MRAGTVYIYAPLCRKKGKKAVKEDLVPAAAAAVNTDELGKEVETMPQFAELGSRFRSCPAVPLTEEGLEYVVTCIKHIFEQHIVLQFKCTNTFPELVRRLHSCQPPDTAERAGHGRSV